MPNDLRTEPHRGHLLITLSPGTEAELTENGHRIGSIGLAGRQTSQVRLSLDLPRSIRITRTRCLGQEATSAPS